MEELEELIKKADLKGVKDSLLDEEYLRSFESRFRRFQQLQAQYLSYNHQCRKVKKTSR